MAVIKRAAATAELDSMVRPDFVPKEAYISSEFVQLEKRQVWSRVWQVACREEEIPNVGDYVTYDVSAESIIVVRTAKDRISAYFNACTHRGRTLTSGVGRTMQFTCRFHGWRFNLDGSCAFVLDRKDWGDSLRDEDINLTSVPVDTWAGFVFVNPDPAAEPLRDYLGDVAHIIDPFEIEKMRYRWYKTVVVKCNWKVALEAFNEGYHVAQTHPQLLARFGDDYTYSRAHGRHSMFGYYPENRPYGAPSPRTGLPMPDDHRPGFIGAMGQIEDELKAITTERGYRAATRLMTEVPAESPPGEVIMKAMQFQAEAAIAEGAGWPNLTMENFLRSGTDWHVFPNLIWLQAPDGVLAYRARPNGDDPHSCIYDIWSLVRYAPGTEPALKREFYPLSPEGKPPGEEIVGKILTQDFANMSEVQKGMRSNGFRGSRTNPKQEIPVSNFHRVLHEYVSGK